MSSINLTKKEGFQNATTQWNILFYVFLIIIPGLLIYNYGLVWGIIISLNVIIYIFFILVSISHSSDNGPVPNAFESEPRTVLGFFICIFFIFTLIPTFLARKFT
jgi:hypothetical protein